MSNGPISLPHINLHRQQEQDPTAFQGLPPMHQSATQNNYFHGQSFSREGKLIPLLHSTRLLLCATEEEFQKQSSRLHILWDYTDIACAGQPMNEGPPKPTAINSGPTP